MFQHMNIFGKHSNTLNQPTSGLWSGSLSCICNPELLTSSEPREDPCILQKIKLYIWEHDEKHATENALLILFSLRRKQNTWAGMISKALVLDGSLRNTYLNCSQTTTSVESSLTCTDQPPVRSWDKVPVYETGCYSYIHSKWHFDDWTHIPSSPNYPQ